MKPVEIRSAEHPITIEPNARGVGLTVAGAVVAESDYSAVQHIPRSDVDMTLLARTENETYCPYESDAAYYRITSGGERTVSALWSQGLPYGAVAAIEACLAFYGDRVDAIEELPA